MGLRGPRPAPVEQKIADGTYRPDRDGPVVVTAPYVKAEVDADGRRFLPCPQSVQSIPGGEEAWDALVGTIIDSGILRESDSFSLEMAAAALARWRLAMNTLSEVGYEVEGKHGPVPAPSVAVAERAEMAWLRWSTRFGLSPSDRASLGMALLAGKASGASDWDDLDDGEE